MFYSTCTDFYDCMEVDRADHLTRVPFYNIVSRFHYFATKSVRNHREKFGEHYTRDRKGFASLCAE